MIVVVKIGTSSLTDKTGAVDTAAIGQLVDQMAEAHAEEHRLLLVTSGAITAGEAVLGIDRAEADAATLQALSTVGQHRLMATYEDAFSRHRIHVGQVLLAPGDFFERSRYLLARRVLERLLEIGVVPVVNENDAVADDAIGFGDNDRIAALVAHLVKADKLLLLTDMEGLFTADPRLDEEASLIAEIIEVNAEMEAAAGAAGSQQSRGGMASKLASAKMAAHSGVEAVIASSTRKGVVMGAIAGEDVGTVFRARPSKLSARKLWIGFAVPSKGCIKVDKGARTALLKDGASLLAVGAIEITGDFATGDAVDVTDPEGEVFAKGLVSMSSAQAKEAIGKRSTEMPEPTLLIHRDQIVLLG